LLFWIAADHFHNEKFRTDFLWHLVIATGLASLLAWWDDAWRIHALHALLKPAGQVRVELRSVGHFNQSGIYLAMAWLIALAASLETRVFYHSWLGRMATVLIGLALLGTTARFALLSAATATGLVFLCRRPPRWLVCFFGIAAVLALAAVLGSSSLRGRLFFQGSFHNRVTFWVSARDAFQHRPWTGVGLNNFRNIQLHTESLSDHGTVDHAHNLYFNTLAQMGLPGIAALLLMISTMGATIWHLGKKRGFKDFAFLASGGVWFVLVMAGLSNTTLHHEMSVLFFLMMAFAEGSSSD